MNRQIPPERGTLYIVPTPIGNLGDMVPRAVEILQAVDLIAAEDTRHSGKLLQHFNVTTPVMAYHDHSDQNLVEALVRRLREGEQIALISDAGTPLISDPGFRLVRTARKAGIRVTPIPGPCALIAALSASGLPSDRFMFEGFLPAKSVARLKTLEKLGEETRTLIFYESPHRLLETLADMQQIFGHDREMVLAREISKTFETFLVGSIADVLSTALADTNQQRGEFVLMVHGFIKPQQASLDGEAQRIAKILVEEKLPVKQVAAITARLTGGKKNQIYQWLIGKGAGSD